MKILRVILILTALQAHGIYAQCPLADFTIPATACLSGNFQIQNTSAADTYDWDFCSGDLHQTPTAQLAFTLTGANGRPGIELAKDGNVWYGFVTGTFSNTLWRLTFANGMISAPSQIDNLGSLGGILNEPGPVRIFNDGGSWYGLIYNAGTTDLIKLSFGSNLSNAPGTSLLSTGIAPAESSINAGLAVAFDGSNGWICVLTNALNQFITLRLGTSISSPGPSDRIVTPQTANNLGDVDVIKICDQWYGFASDFGNGNIYRLKFGSDLFQVPAIDQVTSVGSVNAGRIRILAEGGEYFLLTPSLDGDLHKINFGTDINQNAPVVSNEGNFSSVLLNSYGLGVAKDNSVWDILVVDQGSGKVSRVSYAGTCSALAPGSTVQYPQVSYTTAGPQSISLTIVSGGLSSTIAKSITISASTAPDIDYTHQNSCAQNTINFTSQNSSNNIVSYAWDFGDGQTDPGQNPGHVYSLAGNYATRLTVASSSCSNLVTRNITVYNPPVSDFLLPPVSPVCTNQNYLLTNTSVFDAGSNPSWEWRVNGTLISTQQNLTTTFSSPTAQDIRLKALIPGCENEMDKMIATVTVGPLVNFSVSDNCQANAVPFTNSTSGADAGVSWDFGDGVSSTAMAPSHTYATSGTFQVTLTGNNVQGCQNATTKPVKIYSKPQPDFAVGLPPFSCSNAPTQFQNNTPLPTDSNITSWNWQFGDSGGSTQQVPIHTYTAGGIFNASLQATTNQGCSNVISKPITISASPVADFTMGPACLNQATKFTDLSSGAQSLLWQIGSGTSSASNPTYTFTAAGDYGIVLNATGSNGCIGVKTKTITVPIPPTLNFSVSNPCSGKNTLFTDLTSAPQDVVVGWNWNFAGNSTTGNPANFTFTPEGTYNVKMTTTHLSGCKYTLSKNVVINPSPVAGFTATPSSGSAPLVVQFINTSQQATLYAWKFFDKITATSSSISPVYTFASLGNYSAQLTATNALGCADVMTLPIQVLVPALDLILKDFSMVSDPVTGRLKAVVSILNNSNIPVNTAEVSLILADKSIVNELLVLNLNPGQSITKNMSFTIPQNQSDFVCAEINVDKDVQSDNNKRCINLAEGEYFFSPYPNPSSGVIHMDWISKVSGTGEIIVFDNTGRVAYNWKTPYGPGLTQTVHDLTSLTSGLYYIRITTSTSRRTLRFMRQ